MKQRANLRSPLFLQYESRPAEVESTNLQVYSEEFDNAAWAKTNSSIGSNVIEAPNGELTADKLIGAAVSVGKYTQDVVSGLSTSSKATFSIFLKESELNEVEVLCAQNSSPYTNWARCRFNLSDLDDKGSTIGDFSYEDYGNGWIRLSITGTPVSSGAIIRIALSKDGTSNFTGDGVSGIYLFGAQVEQQEQATSYIKTEATTVTRAATTSAQEQDVTAELRIYSGGGGYDYERTNYALNSTQMYLNNTLTASGSTITKTGDFATAPDGTLTATRLQITGAGAGYALLSVNKTNPANDGNGNGYYRSSVYVKSNTGSNQTIGFYGSSTQGSLSHEITTEWTRIDFVAYRPANAKYAYVGYSASIGGLDTDMDFLVWGGQTELNDLPVTSFIPTEATAVTELAYQTEAPTEATYTLTRTPNNAKSTFEVSELVRDYIEQTLENTSGTTWLEVTLSDSVQLPRYYHFLCTEGYIDNTEGLQTYLNAPSNETFMQSNSTILIPEGESLELPVNAQYNSFYTITTGGVEGSAVYFSNLDDNTTQIEYITVSSTDEVVKLYVDSVVTEEITIQETECSKFDNNKLLFVNKYGAKQEFYVNMKSTEKIRVKDDGFSRNVIDYANLSVTNGLHSYKRRVLESKEMHTLNTPFLDEENVQAFEELLLSEYVWYKKEGGDYIPVIIKDSNMTRKTHLNDKLIQYTIEVESANNLINIQR